MKKMNNMTTIKSTFSQNQNKILTKKGCDKITDDLFTFAKKENDIKWNYKFLSVQKNYLNSKTCYIITINTPKFIQRTTFYCFKDMIEYFDKT
jgi:hypothetical protein